MADKHFVITIARGFGSGGKQIAIQVAEELGINCYEHRIPILAAQYSGLNPGDFEKNDEILKGLYIVNKLSQLSIRMTPVPERQKFKEYRSEHIKYYKYQEKIIRELYETENCIIVGKCADYILKDKENVINIYVDAPREFCVKRIMNRTGVTEEEANEQIEKTDKFRSKYYSFYTFGRKWNDPRYYDLVINSAKVGEIDDLSRCTELIRQYVEMKFGNLECFPSGRGK